MNSIERPLTFIMPEHFYKQLIIRPMFLLQGNLSCHHFREWWREKVPKVLSPKMSMDYLSPQSHIDEDKVNEILIRPLERFLCGATMVTFVTLLSVINRNNVTVEQWFFTLFCFMDDGPLNVNNISTDP